MRMITFSEALNEALKQEMQADNRVFVYGLGVNDGQRVFGSTANLVEMFGSTRCFDTPICEDAMTGFGLGAAINGLKSVHVHIRADFLLLAMNQLVNMVSTYHYMTGGKLKLPFVIRAIIGRGYGQGCQHSKSIYSLFAHIPGLKVVLPTTPRDAKGLLISAIRDNNPVLFVEHRWLYWQKGEVPEEGFSIPLGKSAVIREGKDVTVVGTSWMNVEALKAAEIMERKGVSVEIVDPKTISPLDDKPIVQSIRKTGHCIVVDGDWLHCGFSAEVAARVAENEKCFHSLKKPVHRIGFAPTPCPTARHLENRFYPNAVNIVRAIENMLDLKSTDLSGEDFYSHENRFKGPF